MDDVKIKVINSDNLIDAINKESYEINISSVMALGAVMSDSCNADFDSYVNRSTKGGKMLTAQEKEDVLDMIREIAKKIEDLAVQVQGLWHYMSTVGD